MTKMTTLRNSFTLHCFLLFFTLISGFQTYAQAPANDLICNAVTVTCGTTTPGTLINATNSGTGENNTCGAWAQSTPGVWYKFVGNGDLVTFSMCGQTYDSQLAIFTGTCAAPVCYSANDDNGPACAGLPSSISFTSVVGQTYFIKVFTYQFAFVNQYNFNLAVTCSTPAAAPVNDLICNAITVACGSTTAGTTTGATNFGTNEVNTCGSYTQNTPGVWYKIVGTGQVITASLCGGTNDSELAIFQSATGNCNTATCLASNDDNGPACTGLSASIAWSSVAGTTYFIKVFSYSTATPNFNFNLSVSCTTSPPNNPCAGAVAIDALPFNSGLQTTVGSTNDVPAMSGCGGSGNNNVWYTVLGTGTSITVATTGSSFNSEVAIFSGACGALTYVSCADGGGNNETVTFCSTLGTTYYISVGSGGGGNATGSFTLTVSASGVTGAFAAGDMVWRGSTSNWHTVSNWVEYNGTTFATATSLPDFNKNVFIPPVGGCVSQFPKIMSGNAQAKDVTILPSAKLYTQGSFTFEVKGNWWNDGDWQPDMGEVIFSGTNLQEAGGSGVNYFYDCQVNTAGPGLILAAQFIITHELDMVAGDIRSFAAMPLYVGYYWPAYINWTSGSVVGPLVRWYEHPSTIQDYVAWGLDVLPTSTGDTPVEVIFPVGSQGTSVINRNAFLTYTDGPNNSTLAGGFISGEFIPVNPVSTSAGSNGLSVLTEGGTTYSSLATEGYWEFNPEFDIFSPLVDGVYSLDVRANQFLSVPDYTQARVVKSPDPHTIWSFDGTHGGVTGAAADFTASRDGMVNYSYFAIAYPPASLSAEFKSSVLNCNEGTGELKWITLSEANSDRFVIETSVNGSDWIFAGSLNAAGFSSSELDYRFMMDLKGVEYVRLSEVDNNGVKSILCIHSVNCQGEEAIMTIPNPSSTSFQLMINDMQLTGEVSIEIIDAKSSAIYKQFATLEKGMNILQLETDNLSDGMYFIRVSNGKVSKLIKHSIQN